jgi:predicted RNA-binding protein with TRAM domain
MVEIPNSLRSLFNAPIEEQDGTYTIEVPSSEVEHGALSANETYRVVILDPTAVTESSGQESSQQTPSQTSVNRTPSIPPVDKGEVREVSIETVGDQGDGIAKVERGYVVIVPDGEPGDEPTVKIEQVQKNVAFASIVDSDS